MFTCQTKNKTMSTEIESIIKADFVGFHTVLYLCLFRHRLSSSFLMCVPFQICSLDISCNPSSHSDTPVAHSASQRINKEESIVTLTRANPISICFRFYYLPLVFAIFITVMSGPQLNNFFGCCGGNMC